MRLTQARLKEILEYSPETGVFRRLVRRGPYAAGTVAGGLNHDGYRRIGICGAAYFASHLAHLYMTGEWAPNEMDHKNRVRDDDRWTNLRPATHQQNAVNKNPRGPSGIRGVSFHKATSKWSATVQGKHLGLFDTKDLAAVAYKHVAYCKFGEFAE